MVRTHERPLQRPTGRIVARFRSFKLDWIDPESGDHDQGRVEGPDAYLAELRQLGFRASAADQGGLGGLLGAQAPAGSRDPAASYGGVGSLPAPAAPGRGTFAVRVSPGPTPPGRRSDL